MANATLNYYQQNAEQFQAQYQQKTAEEVHASWQAFWPTAQHLGQALDVGAGVGRDAAWLSSFGWDVVAVEPVEAFRELGKTQTQNLSVSWLNDQLPAISNIIALEMKFDLILLSAVWMHIPASDRQRAFRKLASLLKPNGIMVISLRHGSSPDERHMYPVSMDELKSFSVEQGLTLAHHVSDDQDKLGRNEVTWETCVFKLPDDGTGAFPLIRHVIINDAKSSTYKLALLRTLLRIADGHPGAVIRREDGSVIIPLGLVSLYWMRQYLILIQQDIRQGTHAAHTNDAWQGLGFIEAEGMLRFQYHSAADFSIGHIWFKDEAIALQKSLTKIGEIIKKMPVTHITMQGTDKKTVFEVQLKKRTPPSDRFHVTFESLSAFGEFSIPEHIWHIMCQYACWIEPVIVNEWVTVMQSYPANARKTDHQLRSSLTWLEPKRTTQQVRNRIESLQQQGQNVYCVWGNTKLSTSFVVDHCLPFARWPNNDLWNLLPSTVQNNSKKSDKLASSSRLNNAKHRIQEWWQQAWLEDTNNRQLFWTQAQFSLPGLHQITTPNTEEIMAALTLQHIRLREQQQLAVWK